MRGAIIGLLVLVGLLVAADFGAAALAESAVSKQMRQQIGLADDPQVTINGFPFLTQAIAGRYGSVDIDAPRITVGQFKNLEVKAQLRNVDAPLSMVLGSGPKTLQVAQAQGSVRISAKDLQELVPNLQNLRIDPVDAQGLADAVKDGSDPSVGDLDPADVARLSGTTTVPVLGRQDVSVIATLELDGGVAKIVPHDIRLGSDLTPIPAAFQGTLQKAFTVSIDPGSLPLKVTPTSLTAVDGTLEVSGTAQNLTLGGSQSLTAG